MSTLSEKTADTCRQLYECIQAGYSQNQASRIIGKSPSWASRWLPIYLQQRASSELARLEGKNPHEREAERLRRVAEDCHRAARKIDHLFSFDWGYPELSQVSTLRSELRRSLLVSAQRLAEKRKLILKDAKAHRGR